MKRCGHISFFWFPVLFLASSCKDNPVTAALSPDDQIREAVFVHEFQHNGSGVTNPAVVFLGLGPWDSLGVLADPSEALMQRFAGSNPPVKKFSQIQFKSSGYYDIETDQRGILFFVFPIQWNSGASVQVPAGYMYSGLNGENDLFFLHLANGSWTIDSVHVTGSF